MNELPGSADQIRRAVDGDTEALAELLRRFGPQVRRALQPKIPSRWQSVLTVDDVLQQTYTDAFLDIGRFRPSGDGAFAAWLKRLAENNLNDALRMLEAEKRGGRRPRQAPVGEQSFDVLMETLAADSKSTPSQHAARGEVVSALRHALERLPADYRKVVTLYDLEGGSIEEVASSLQRSQGATYLLRHRAHRALRECLGSDSRFFSDSP